MACVVLAVGSSSAESAESSRSLRRLHDPFQGLRVLLHLTAAGPGLQVHLVAQRREVPHQRRQVDWLRGGQPQVATTSSG